MKSADSFLTQSKQEPNKLFVYLTCLYIVTWYLQLGSRVEILGTIRFEFLLGALLSLCAIMVYFTSNTTNSPLLGPVLFFLGVLFCYTIFSYDFEHSWDIFFNRVIKFSMLALFLSVFVRTPWALKMVLGAFLLAMLKLGQEGFVGWLTGSMMWQNQGVMRLHGSVGLYAHPNSFSGMAVGCLPFIYYLFPVSSKIWKCLLIILLLFSITIILFTGSRTGYVASIGLVAVFFIKSTEGRRWRNFIVAALICIITIILTPTDYIERFHSIFTLQEKEGASSERRIEIIVDSLKVFIAHPMGVGVGAFPLVREEMFGRNQDTHNLYLELLTNLGPIGLLAFITLVIFILKTNNEIQSKLKKSQTSEKLVALATSHSITAFIYSRLFLGIFGMDTYEIYWWFSVGFTIILWNITNTYEKNQDNKMIQ